MRSVARCPAVNEVGCQISRDVGKFNQQTPIRSLNTAKVQPPKMTIEHPTIKDGWFREASCLSHAPQELP